MPNENKILSATAIIAFLATALGASNNMVYLVLGVIAVTAVSKRLRHDRIFQAAGAALLLATLIGTVSNGAVAALRSATPYLALLAAVSLVAPQRKVGATTNYNNDTSILIMYVAGLLQLATYLVQTTFSTSYSWLYSNDEFHRYSVGWISIVCFFHATLHPSKKPNLSRLSRRLGYIFWLVPILTALNSSRSELLIVVLLFGISMTFRRPILLASTVTTLGIMALFAPNLSDSISGLARASRSIEEIFQGDFNTISDVYTNYRAFENAMMLDRIASGGPLKIVTGCGLGCAVPFPFTMTLEEIEYDEIAVFHNGYLTVLLHFGLLGIALLATLIALLVTEAISFARHYRGRLRAINLSQYTAIRFAVLFILLGTAFTTGGFMSSQDILTMLLPLSCALPSFQLKKVGAITRYRPSANAIVY